LADLEVDRVGGDLVVPERADRGEPAMAFAARVDRRAADGILDHGVRREEGEPVLLPLRLDGGDRAARDGAGGMLGGLAAHERASPTKAFRVSARLGVS